jgi:tripartite-type tricarboxylate transporter receptor subunit TctC
MVRSIHSTLLRIGAVGFALFVVSAWAAEWPAKPIRMVVPFAAGGAADVLARVYADALSQGFNAQFVVENRTGAGGLVGAQSVARSDPDGYTLMSAGMSSHVLAPATSKNPGFDPIADFTHIAYFGGAPSVILVHPSLGVSSFKELIARVRSTGGLEYVSSGTGTVGNVLAEYIGLKENLKLAHVPYRAGSGAVVDLLAGRVTMGALNWSTAREHVRAGALKALAVSSAHRMPMMPDLPTLAELGYPDMVTTTWHMLAGPAALPKEIVGQLNREVLKIIERPEMRKNFENDAIEPQAMTPAELTQFVHGEIEKWAPVARAAAAKSQ